LTALPRVGFGGGWEAGEQVVKGLDRHPGELAEPRRLLTRWRVRHRRSSSLPPAYAPFLLFPIESIKQFLGKIDQLLSYLTWRDSKTALICFVRNKDFGTVVETIKKAVPSHTCFVKEHPPISEAWLRYEFTLQDDPSRSVSVAILCFHFP
jgi:hypothetical protein